MHVCWCGNTDFVPFGSEYGECKVCGSLVSLTGFSNEQMAVRDDETDFYGKNYWFDHQQQDLNFPNIYARARNDLTERNLHWLKTLLKYGLPPATVLELGCSHGSFIALMQQTGYQASGIEMSPWVIAFGQETFGITVHKGPIESLELPRDCLDLIACMDVLEHLPDPSATMRHCLELLKPEGLLLIQTPEFQEGARYEELVESQNVFLELLQSDEHLYLFSQRAVTEFFRRLGAEYIYFESAIFNRYDMFFAVSQSSLEVNTPEKVESVLLATPNGRLILALLDMYERELDLTRKWKESETDRKERGTQIETLAGMLQKSESDRTERGAQIETLTRMLHESESDRTVRGTQIETLAGMLQKSESDRTERGAQIETLTRILHESESDRAARGTQIETLTALLQKLEFNLAARGD